MQIEEKQKKIPEEVKQLSKDFADIGFIYEWKKGALDWE